MSQLVSRVKKGFTLIELLVVIAIIAILSVILITILNPAELLKQARDSTRISDLSVLKSAIALYLADVKTNISIGASGTCYVYGGSGVTISGCSHRYTTDTTLSSTTTRAVDGTGWIPVNFNAISSGSPISILPIDPVDNTTYFYSYAADTTNLTFVLDAKMESKKYSDTGSSDVESTDGGTSSTLYEVGSTPGLSL